MSAARRRRARGTTCAWALSAALAASACSSRSEKAPSASAAPSLAFEFKATDGSHGARFFQEPKLEEKDEGTQPSGIGLLRKSASASDDTRYFVVSKLELSHVTKYDCDAGLAGMVKTSLASMGCEPTTEAPTKWSGRVARDVDFACTKSPARGKMRVVCEPKELSRGRVDAYSIMALFQEGAFDGVAATAFVDSLELR